MNKSILEYSLFLGDTTFILGHRLSENCSRGITLEEDIACTNIALDYIGQGEAFLKYACQIENKEKTVDDLIYKRLDVDFKNLLISEEENKEYSDIVVKHILVSFYLYLIYNQIIKENKNKGLVDICKKAIKETSYHVKHFRKWFLILALGTKESKERLENSFEYFWIYVGEIFCSEDFEKEVEKKGILKSLKEIEKDWFSFLEDLCKESSISIPNLGKAEKFQYIYKGGKKGEHTERLTYILSDIQYISRQYPNSDWSSKILDTI